MLITPLQLQVNIFLCGRRGNEHQLLGIIDYLSCDGAPTHARKPRRPIRITVEQKNVVILNFDFSFWGSAHQVVWLAGVRRGFVRPVIFWVSFLTEEDEPEERSFL